MMKRMSVVRLALVALAGMALPSFATTWYVDAENGNDDWNGQANFANAVPANNIGPKKTLAVFTNLLANSDTIYVAPGWYTNGVAMVYTNNLPEKLVRFYTAKSSISLIATGCATNTFICGAPDPDVNQTKSPYGCGPKAIGAIKMKGGNCLIKGVTICNGRSPTWEDKDFNYGAGGYFSLTDRMVDCIVTNCVANRGGGVHNLGYALRCRFTGNFATQGSHAMILKTAVNCIFENADGYAVYNVNTGGKVLNCLFRGNTNGNCRTNGGTIDVWNSVLLRGSATSTPKNKYCYFHNCLFDFDPVVLPTSTETIRGTNEECRIVAPRLLKFNDDGSPAWGNIGTDAAAASYYNDNFPSVFDASEKSYDCLGNARTVGAAMDLGAVERTSDTFDDNTWFVDANNGDDANSGRTSEQAFRTLARASTNALMKAGGAIYVAEGVYDQGVVPAAVVGAVENSTDCRLLVSSVDVVATGRREATIIKGQSDTSTSSGIGPNAVRCCTMVGGTLTGFTLQNGNVNVGNSSALSAENYDTGGGVYGRSSPYVFDCEIKNCNAVRGGGAASAILVRCYVHDNTRNVGGTTGRSPTASGLFSCSAYNTVVKGDECYTGSYYLNCTFTGKCWGGNTTFANCYIGLDGAGGSSVAATFTNCVCATAFSTYAHKGGCIENRPCQFGSKWRPVGDDSAVVNAGDYALYTSKFPVSLLFCRDIDYAGNPRVLDGSLDIGAAEYKPVGSTIMLR